MSRISTAMMSQRALTSMLNQQSKISDTQNQIATGRRVMTPADDPASAARVLDLNNALETVQQYQSNADRLRGRLETEEGALVGIGNLLQRANELAIQGNNDTLTQADTQIIATEIRQLLNNLLALGNTRDGNGEYIFAGYQTDTQPFPPAANGVYNYAGDMGPRMLQISPDRQVSDGDNGFEVFMDVRTSRVATVTTGAAGAFTAINAGDITVDGGNGNGPVALEAIPPAANAAERAAQLSDAINRVADRTGVRAVVNPPGDTLTLTGVGGSGITVGLAGTANVANTGLNPVFTPSAPDKRSIFQTLDLLAQALDGNQPLDRYIGDVQLALENVVEVRTTVGARLNAVDEQVEVNATFELSMQSHRSAERDLDYTEAIARFERQMVSLQAAQQAYLKIHNLSLFNFM